MELLWTDIETTGLDERGGLVLELGLLITGTGWVERASMSVVIGARSPALIVVQIWLIGCNALGLRQGVI